MFVISMTVCITLYSGCRCKGLMLLETYVIERVCVICS